MRNTYRNSEIIHVSSVKLIGDEESVRQISACYKWADKNIKTCVGCNDVSKITVLADTGEEYYIPCPIFSKDCKYGLQLKTQAENYALSVISKKIPRGLSSNMQKPRMTYAIQQAMSWEPKGMIYLFGDTGTGKSFAAAWILYNAKLQQYLKYLRFPVLWNDSTSHITWLSAYRAVSDKIYINTACHAPVLVLDDLGEEPGASNNKATIGEIINERYNGDNITIITSNVSIDDISARYNRRVEERIAKAKLVQCMGVSQRTVEIPF